MRSLMATIGAAKACVATSTAQHSQRLCGRFIPFGKLKPHTESLLQGYLEAGRDYANS